MFDKSSQESSKKCRHCKQPVDRCVVTEMKTGSFVLFCSACENMFTVPKSEDYSITSGRRRYSRREEAKSLDQIGVCDFIQYETSIWGTKRVNFAICTQIDRSSRTARVVRLTLNDDAFKVVESEVAEDTLVQKEAVVYRFMPLDCCSMDETLGRAKESVLNGEMDWLMTAVCESLDFEKFAHWLKTGEATNLIPRVNGVINKCPNQKCSAPLYRSSYLKSSQRQFYCTACRERYEVQDNEEHLVGFRHRYGEPYKTEELSSVDQIEPGDILKISHGIFFTSYTHYLICTDVDRKTNIIEVVSLAPKDKKMEIKSQKMKFEEMQNSNATVDRYLSLDCLPSEETVKKAKDIAVGNTIWEPEEDSNSYRNCQHFASFCKTGRNKRKTPQLTSGISFNGYRPKLMLGVAVK